MSNYFPNFNNLYGNLAQGSYPDAPLKFPNEALENDPKLKKLMNGQSVAFDFSQTVTYRYKSQTRYIPGGSFKRDPNADPNLPQEGLVHLQPENTLIRKWEGQEAYFL